MRRGAFPCDEAAEPRYVSRGASVAAYLARVDRVLTSPALRARQTAEAFMPMATEEEALADQDFGEWAGKELAQLQDIDPGALGAWLSDPSASPPGGESFVQVCDRIEGFMAGLLGRSGATVAVTHPAVVRAAILSTLGVAPACFARIDIEPLSLTEFRGDGRRWMLRATGVTVPAGPGKP
jgi:broad specificity phosphatase PhoE